MVDDLTDRLRSLPPQDLPHPPDRHARVLRRARSHQRRVRAAAAVSTVLVVGGAVAALANTLPGTGGGAQLRAGASQSVSSGSAGASSSGSGASSGAGQPAPSPAAASHSPNSTPGQVSPGVVPACPAAVLRVTISQSQGAAGTYFQTISFQNTGRSTCSLDGYPGVSFTDPSGVQMGQDAQRRNEFAQPEGPVAIPAGGTAQATVGITDTGAVPQTDCQARSASQMRIYPPNQQSFVLLPDPVMICTIGDHRPYVTPVVAPAR